MKQKSKYFYFHVKGIKALFTDPISSSGGDKTSLEIPTYSALIGLLKHIFWKPTIQWVIDEIRVINRIEMTQGIATQRSNVSGGSKERAYYTYLRNPEYLIKAHLIFNENQPEMKDDRNMIKYENIVKRMAEAGGRMETYLGLKNCYANIRLCGKEYYENAKSAYDTLSHSIVFKNILYGKSYPDEITEQGKKNGYDGYLLVCYWDAELESGGRIKFVTPDETRRRKVKKMAKKNFINNRNSNGTKEIEENPTAYGFENIEEVSRENALDM